MESTYRDLKMETSGDTKDFKVDREDITVEDGAMQMKARYLRQYIYIGRVV